MGCHRTTLAKRVRAAPDVGSLLTLPGPTWDSNAPPRPSAMKAPAMRSEASLPADTKARGGEAMRRPGAASVVVISSSIKRNTPKCRRARHNLMQSSCFDSSTVESDFHGYEAQAVQLLGVAFAAVVRGHRLVVDAQQRPYR